MQFKLSVKIIIVLIFAPASFIAQNISSENLPKSEKVIALINYDGYSFLVTPKGITPTSAKTVDAEFSEYYKRIYGKNSENPNHIIESNNGFSFIPILNQRMLNELGIDSVDGFSVEDLYKLTGTDNSSEDSSANQIKRRLIKYIKGLDENIKK